MITSYQLFVPKFVFTDGFGFLCMKEAYKNHITGRLHYGPNIGVHIVAVGKTDELMAFVNWLRSFCSIEINIIKKQSIATTNFSEFDIIYTENEGLIT